MRQIIAASFAIALAVGPAAASDKTDVMATVRQFADAFNKGDVNAALGDCAAQSFIIDEFPPHLWQGATGCADWSKDFDAYSNKNGITDPIVTLHSPTHVDVTGDRAYVVVPANYSFKQNGKRLTERGSIWTIVLQKAANHWRLTGWSWAEH